MPYTQFTKRSQTNMAKVSTWIELEEWEGINQIKDKDVSISQWIRRVIRKELLLSGKGYQTISPGPADAEEATTTPTPQGTNQEVEV